MPWSLAGPRSRGVGRRAAGSPLIGVDRSNIAYKLPERHIAPARKSLTFYWVLGDIDSLRIIIVIGTNTVTGGSHDTYQPTTTPSRELPPMSIKTTLRSLPESRRNG